MEQFSGEKLHDAFQVIERLICQFGQMGHVELISEMRQGVEKESLFGVEGIFKSSGLLVSAETVYELRTELANLWTIVTASYVVSRLQEIQRNVRREMRNTVFFYISPDDARWFERPLGEWEEAAERFREVANDMQESSLCFGSGRYAGAVFHALLVAEFGVIQLAKLFGVAGDKPGWGAIRRLQDIAERDFKDKTQLERHNEQLLKDMLPFLATIQKNWRHRIAHVDNKLVWESTTFTPQVAREIISSTRIFMLHLAADLPRPS